MATIGIRRTEAIRDEVVSILNEYGGELVEYPYSNDERYRALEQRSREHLSIPDIRGDV